MTVYIRLLKDRWHEQTSVVIFEHGKLRTPIVLLDDYEFEKIIEEYWKQKEAMEKSTKEIDDILLREQLRREASEFTET